MGGSLVTPQKNANTFANIRSITLEDMEAMLKKFSAKIGKNENDVTSKDLQALFQTPEAGFKAGVHLCDMDEYKEHFQLKPPDVAVSYTWVSNLQFIMRQLKSFLKGGSIRFGNHPPLPENTTFWVDIFFNDQNSIDILTELAIAEMVYKNATYHVMALNGAPLTRGWCLFEIVIRKQSKEKQPTVYIGHGGWPTEYGIYAFDWYKGMLTYSPNDRLEIQKKILTVLGTARAFNQIVYEAAEKNFGSSLNRIDRGVFCTVWAEEWKFSPSTKNVDLCGYCCKPKERHVFRGVDDGEILPYCFHPDYRKPKSMTGKDGLEDSSIALHLFHAQNHPEPTIFIMSYHGYWVSKYGSRRLYGVNTIHYSTPSSYSLDDSKFLPTIFTCSKNLKGTLISYFHEWLRKEQDSFSAIDANVTSNGMTFLFRSSPGSSLVVYFKEKEADFHKEFLDIVCDIQIASKDERTRSLLLLITGSIVESLTKDLAEMKESFLSTPPLRPDFNETPVNSVIVVNHDNTSQNQQHHQLGVVLKSWDSSHKLNVSAIQFLHEWSLKFSVGVGISTTMLDAGVDVRFISFSYYLLQLRITDDTMNIASILLYTNSIENCNELQRKQIERAADGIVSDLNTSLLSGKQSKVHVPAGSIKNKTTPQMKADVKTSLPSSSSSSSLSSSSSSTVTVVETESSSSDTSDEDDDLKSIENSFKKVSSNPLISNTFSSSESSSSSQQFTTEQSSLSSSSSVSASAVASQQQTRFVDPTLQNKAKQLGVRLEKFAASTLSDKSIEDFNEILQESNKKGIFSYFESIADKPVVISLPLTSQATTSTSSSTSSSASASTSQSVVSYKDINSDMNTDIEQLFKNTNNAFDKAVSSPTQQQQQQQSTASGTQSVSLRELFDIGSQEILQNKLSIQQPPPLTIFPNIDFTNPISSPSFSNNDLSSSYSTSSVLSSSSASAADLLSQKSIEIRDNERKLLFLINELQKSLPERHEDILNAFDDLLLSEHILPLLKAKSYEIDLSEEIKILYSKIATKAAYKWSQLSNLVAQESVHHLETVLEICRISRDYQHNHVLFQEKMDAIKPYFDTTLLSYLRFAIKEEENIIRMRSNTNTNSNSNANTNSESSIEMKASTDDPAKSPSMWLQVLTIVYQGVSSELETRFERILDPLIYIIRFNQPDIRTRLFARLVNTLPALDLPYLRTLAENMVDYSLNNLVQPNHQQHQSKSQYQSQQKQQKQKQQKQKQQQQGTDMPNTALTQGSISSPPSPLLSDEPMLYEKMKTLAQDIHTYLSDEILQQRIDGFKQEAKDQGSELVVGTRNAMLDDAQKPVEERKKWIGSSILDATKINSNTATAAGSEQ